MKNLLSKKLFSAGGAMGGICFLASLVASGGLTVPVGLAFAVLVGVVSTMHMSLQGQIDKPKVPPVVPEEKPTP